jgi:ApaG protein
MSSPASPRRVVVALFRALLREARLLTRARARLRLFAPLAAAEAARRFGAAGVLAARGAEPAEALQRRVFAGHALAPLLLRELGLAGRAALSGAEVAAAARRGVRMQPPAPGGLDAGLAALQALARLRTDAATSTASEATHARGTAVAVELTTAALSPSDLGAGASEAADGSPKRHFAFAYRVTVTNTGNKTLQLLARHWLFSDADGGAIVVPRWSAGVVGEQPILQPLQSFSYVSGVELRTPTGTMSGGLRLLVPSESEFVEVSIAETALNSRSASGGSAGPQLK